MFTANAKLAMQALWSAKSRTSLTMLGVIIGVFSVVVTVCVGLGIRQQITNQIEQLGPDLITVIPDNNTSTNTTGLLKRLDVLPTLGTGSFSLADLTAVQNTSGVNLAVPISYITGNVSINGTNTSTPVIATTNGFPAIVNQTLFSGQFFIPNPDGSDTNEAIIGQDVASNLFKQSNPIGSSFTVRNRTFIVEGVLNNFDSSPLTPITNYNDAIFIPFDAGVQMTGGNPPIAEILAKPNSLSTTNQVVKSINQTLLNSRGGESDFSVLEQQQNLTIATKTLNILTGLVAAVAAISFIVGGIGIMNIMLVSVIERTHEIGVRKAIGATNHQILMQFLIESGVIGLIGGVIGALLALIADILIEFFSPVRPALSFPIFVISVGVALAAGLLFGAMPAIKAARKDPIDSLRHE